MDYTENKKEIDETITTKQARQRATIKWLLSKAFNNKVPENLKEPFYRDHENQEHLKPQIVGALANAEIYCLALGNIYSDPNYHNLNHWAILQTLARKGININKTSESQLTETTLIQTNPIRMNAHMAVIESIMSLYAKEVVTPERVVATIKRFFHNRIPVLSQPENAEQGILLWISHACEALRNRIEQDLGDKDGLGNKLKAPNFPPIRELKDLCDGVGLVALVSFYCPDELPWTDFKISYIPTVQESLHNVTLLQNFCTRCLPASIFHMSPEDITYMRDTMKLNLIAFLADLYNLLEIQGTSCVKYPSNEIVTDNEISPCNSHGVVHKRNLMQTVMIPIPDLRSGLDSSVDSSAFQGSRSAPAHIGLRKSNPVHYSTSQMSEDSLWKASEESFVVHRGKKIPTLTSVFNDEPMSRLKNNKDKQNNDTKSDEKESFGKAAGKPSNWEESKKPSFSGRRSRRNSVTEDSQLTIENFGGSQDNLNFIGRNPDKELTVHSGRKISAPSLPIENPAVRSSLKDARGSIVLGYDDGSEKQDTEPEKLILKRQLSNDDIALRKIMNSQSSDKENLIRDLVDGEVINRISSFADIKKQSLVENSQKGIQLVYMQHDKEDVGSYKAHQANGTEKKTTFAELPNNQTTWQQQFSNQQIAESNGKEENGLPNNVTAQINDIRLKLEEKRRHIESEKRRMEVAMNKHRQKIGKAAFLQAVTKDVNEDVSVVERKWLTNDQPFIETKRTPELENMDMEQYQQSIAQIDSSLHDIHSDIQRLQTQQSQLQAAQQQNLLLQQQKQLNALQQQYHEMHHPPPPQYHQQHSYTPQLYQPVQAQSSPAVYPPPLQTSSSVPHIPHALYNQQPQFFLHDQSQQNTPPIPTQRRTWAQQSPSPQSFHLNNYNSPGSEMRTWGKPQNPSSFLLHDSNAERYHNGEGRTVQHSNSFTLSQQHLHNQNSSFGTSHSTPSASPQHRNIHKQISQLMDKSNTPVSLQQMDVIPPQRKISITHAPIPAPSADDMEPQNISFIGNSDDQQINESLSKLNITSGSRTYRIPSPTRPSIAKTSFRPTSPPTKDFPKENNGTDVSSLNTERDPTSQKGFYISFDNEQPKRPKPPLRTKRGSPKKERSFAESEDGNTSFRSMKKIQEGEKKMKEELNLHAMELEERKRQQVLLREQEMAKAARDAAQERQNLQQAAAAAIIIGNELSNPDPLLIDEREKKKEKIMMLSLQRRQQQEEEKRKKEQQAQMRREAEKAKEEEKLRKKEEQAARRAVILEQYKLKKAIEEAEREGKVVDKSEYMSSLKPTPRTRPKAASRPRPKTIHIDSGSVEMAGGMLEPSRGKKGSTSNLTANFNSGSNTLKRDYYRGSQDSLADKGMNSGLLYRDSPDDSRGMSPCHSANQTLGRRSSYKTSRDPSPAQVRGRSKFSTYQNFKGRKSSSLMNLYGSSTDQDSLAYRYGETDSGLGRATPPRRAPSPGMGSLRHLPSPSGPGSLPGLMSKGRRLFDDGSSDISSTPSSMMDYTGPRLYKQPATKSNRSIMLNAVEYCVFPGVVNKEAKRRVLEEINRSESKHFLILFRDAGCQFRALYSYCPDREEVSKLYGTGPKQVNDRMFDKFFKYNSGGKCFSQVHTKHLTVTIDAFTIHNSLWQGKKVNLPNKKDMTLVI